MSPLRTLISCGSSSRLVLRRNFPIVVTRLSFVSLYTLLPFRRLRFVNAFFGDQLGDELAMN